MWACLVHVIQCVSTVRLTHMLYAADSMHVCVRLPSLYMCTTYAAVRKNISAASSTKHRKKMISLHLTGVSCNADDNKTAKLQR